MAKALLEEEKLHRAGSYLAVIALPLVEKPKPYCLAMVAVGEGFGSHEIMRIQSSVADVFYKSGLRTVSSGGDGDSGLRVLQNSSIYTKILSNWDASLRSIFSFQSLSITGLVQ